MAVREECVSTDILCQEEGQKDPEGRKSDSEGPACQKSHQDTSEPDEGTDHQGCADRESGCLAPPFSRNGTRPHHKRLARYCSGGPHRERERCEHDTKGTEIPRVDRSRDEYAQHEVSGTGKHLVAKTPTEPFDSPPCPCALWRRDVAHSVRQSLGAARIDLAQPIRLPSKDRCDRFSSRLR